VADGAILYSRVRNVIVMCACDVVMSVDRNLKLYIGAVNRTGLFGANRRLIGALYLRLI